MTFGVFRLDMGERWECHLDESKPSPNQDQEEDQEEYRWLWRWKRRSFDQETRQGGCFCCCCCCSRSGERKGRKHVGKVGERGGNNHLEKEEDDRIAAKVCVMAEKVIERVGTFSVCREERLCLDARVSVLLEADQTGRGDQMERMLDLKQNERKESQSKQRSRVQESSREREREVKRDREFKREREREFKGQTEIWAVIWLRLEINPISHLSILETFFVDAVMK